jgi:hypothetical protein
MAGASVGHSEGKLEEWARGEKMHCEPRDAAMLDSIVPMIRAESSRNLV